MRKRFKFSYFLFFISFNYSVSQTLYETEGFASYYSEEFHGRKTANGEIYDMNKFTCAHPYLPFNTWLKVTNVANQKSVLVRVNDRGPFLRNRIIDLSYAAAKQLGMLGPGTIYVKLEIVDPPSSQPEQLNNEPVLTIPELTEEELNIRFRTKPLQQKHKLEISEFGLFDLNSRKIDITSGYLIQLSSFSTLKNAQIFIDQITEIPKEMIYIYHPSNGIYRVVVGIFNSMRDALLKKNEIATHFPECFVITYR